MYDEDPALRLGSIILLGLVVCLFVGRLFALIAPAGTRLRDADFCRFRVGRSTPLEVIAELGEPRSRSRVGGVEGAVLQLTYKYDDSNVKEVTVFSFREGVLREVTAAAGSPFADATTPRTLPTCLREARVDQEKGRPGPWRLEAAAPAKGEGP